METYRLAVLRDDQGKNDIGDQTQRTIFSEVLMRYAHTFHNICNICEWRPHLSYSNILNNTVRGAYWES